MSGLTPEEREALIRAANEAWDNGVISVGAMVEALLPTVEGIKVAAADQARAEVVAAVERIPATRMTVGHRDYWMVEQAALRATLPSGPTLDAIAEPRVCDHKYPPEREDGTCPSCDKLRDALATEPTP